MRLLYQVSRGGCWHYVDATCLAARARSWYAPSNRYDFLGFRCARRVTDQATLRRQALQAEGGVMRLLYQVSRGGCWYLGAAVGRAAYRYADKIKRRVK